MQCRLPDRLFVLERHIVPKVERRFKTGRSRRLGNVSTEQ